MNSMNTPKRKNFREEMPEIAAWIDSLRKAFGKDYIDDIMRQGMKGEPVFYARKGDIEIGTKVLHTSADKYVTMS